MNCVFICVNFNGAIVTEKFLSSVELLNDINLDISTSTIVVDNASNPSDKSEIIAIVEKFSSVTLILSETNLGYFGGLNLGILNLDAAKYDFIVVCNNDVTFDPQFAQILSKRRYQTATLVVAPNVITLDGYNQNPHCIARVSSFRKFLYQIYYINFSFARILTFVSRKLSQVRGGRYNKSANVSQYIHMGIGACYVLTPEFFKYFSKLDDSVFLYGEEALLAGQVMSANGKTFYDSDLIVHHAESAALSKLPSLKVYQFAKQSYDKYKMHL